MVTDPQSWKDLAWLTFVGHARLHRLGVRRRRLWADDRSALLTAAGVVLVAAQRRRRRSGCSGSTRSARRSWRPTSALVAIPVLYLLAALDDRGAAAAGQSCCSAPTREAALRARVSELAATRAGAVDAAAAELQRIERDLHDGAQARLVALALDLGMAEERFARDPEGARELVGEAREEAKRALAELRDLARGIRPSLLAERGLGPALTALAARSPVPAPAWTSTCPTAARRRSRTPTWFVVSEALANAGKHSGAARVARHASAATSGTLRRRGRRRRRAAAPTPAGERPDRACAAASRRSTATLDRRQPRTADPTVDQSGAAMRVVIAEDLALLRDGLIRLLRDTGFEVAAAVEDPDALPGRRRGAPARRLRGRRAAAADVHRRGRARRAGGAPPDPGAADPDPLPVRRADVRRRAVRRRPRRRRLPAQGPRRRRAPTSSPPSGAWPRAARRSTPRRSRSCSCPPAPTTRWPRSPRARWT